MVEDVESGVKGHMSGPQAVQSMVCLRSRS